MMDELDRQLINWLQGGLPIAEAPFAAAAAALGLAEDEVVQRLRRLAELRVLSRVGPMYDAVRLGGGLTLAAMAVPEARFDEVAELVNAYPEVAHNYRREHRCNMWFVLATERPERVGELLAEIAARTGLAVLDLPKEAEYFLALRLPA